MLGIVCVRMQQPLEQLIRLWRDDAAGTYRSWFLWEDRIKNFSGIRRALREVVSEIENGSFGNLYKGSSLETAVKSIAEQRQIFKGADHAFLWKPKLRIPDIYESPKNQAAFGRFLRTALEASRETQLIDAIQTLDQQQIKGLGPAAANLLYFLHPTLMPPFNTAILGGFNKVMDAKLKLGSWRDYLSMRSGILQLNADHQTILSNDLGAIAGLLFDIGTSRYDAPEDAGSLWRLNLEAARDDAKVRSKRGTATDDISHQQVQGWLLEIGRALGYETWVAANDRSRSFGTCLLGDLSLAEFPAQLRPGSDAVPLIDVIWFEKKTARVAAAFEVEHTTSIYSGIVRLLDVSAGLECCENAAFFLVAPDSRAADVLAQLQRPAFRHAPHQQFRFLPYSELQNNRQHISRFGTGLKAIEAVAKAVC